MLVFDDVDNYVRRFKSGPSDRAKLFHRELQRTRNSRNHLTVIVTTNNINDLPAEVLAEFDLQIKMGYPDAAEREAIFSVHLKGKNLGSDVDVAPLAASTEGMSGERIRSIVDDAWHAAVSRQLRAGEHTDGAVLRQEDLTRAAWNAGEKRR